MKPPGIPMRRSPTITVMPPRPSASMALAGMQSFRAQHSNGYQSCPSAGTLPRTILASPAMAANAKGADIFFIDRPAEQSKDERHVDAAERAVCLACSGVTVPWGGRAVEPSRYWPPGIAVARMLAKGKSCGRGENELQHACFPVRMACSRISRPPPAVAMEGDGVAFGLRTALRAGQTWTWRSPILPSNSASC